MEGAAATYGWVFAQVRVDPNNENTVYFMGLGLNQSTDGGKTFKPLRGMHGDHHALWIDPANSDNLINGNDGGVVMSYDGGKTWRQFLDNLPVVHVLQRDVRQRRRRCASTARCRITAATARSWT